jgi:ferric-dicitrate binding protein FerR (iron transport regulator)
MTPEELHRLVEEYREGTISVEEAQHLAAMIRSDRESVRRELAFSGLLGQALEEADEESFVRSFSERLSAERGGDEFMTAFRKRTAALGRTRRARTPRPSALPFLVAAGFLVAILAAAMGQKNPAPAPASVVKQSVPTPPPEEPKPDTPILSAPPPEPLAPSPNPPKPNPSPQAVPEAPVKPPDPPAPVAPPEAPKVPPARPTEVTRTAIARLDRVAGEVSVGVDGDRRAARAGLEIPAGLSVSTGLRNSSAGIVLPDGTRITIGPDATIREIAKGPKGMRIFVTLGTVTADVARQPADQPLAFVSPHGEAKVLGTVLRLVVEGVSTRVEVKEGKVQLTREGKAIIVSAGQYAVAGAGAPMAPKSLSADEVVLLPQQVKLTGAEWSLQRDIRSLTGGSVLEAGPTAFKVVDHVETRPSYATYTFFASADREYRIWIRAASQEKGDPWNRDMVIFEPTRATLSQKSPFFGAAPTTAWVVTGVSASPGFTWMSGHGEDGKIEPPLVVKFHETGFQNIRLYVGHPWVRVDAIWLSTTQKSRPNARFMPPVTEK